MFVAFMHSLPTHVREWGGPNGDQFLRMTANSNNLHPEYVSRRIIGLRYQQLVFDGPTGAIVSKVVFQHDLGGEFRQFRCALRKADEAALNSIYADDYAITTDNGDVQTKVQRLAWVKANMARLSGLEFHVLKVRAAKRNRC
ncbi:MAG TPA: hypothetical protein VF064_20900 [Pyrinomonadaceae bacterium]